MFITDGEQIKLIQKELDASHTRMVYLIAEVCHSLLYIYASQLKMEETVQALEDYSDKAEIGWRKMSDQFYEFWFILESVILQIRRTNMRLEGMVGQIF